MIGKGAYSVPYGNQRALLLSNGEWCRFKDSAMPPPEALRFDKWAVERLKRIERRRDNSNAILDTWDNTIKGQEQKLLNVRRKRAEEEEAEKRKLDVKEEEQREQKRKEDIEAAKTLIFAQKDDIKTLHGAYLFSEILKERGAQVEFRKYINGKEEELEKEYVRKMKDDVENYYTEKIAALDKKRLVAKENEDLVMEQICEHQQNEEQMQKQKEREKEILDTMRKDYEDYIIQQKEEEEQKKKIIKEVLEQNMEEKRQFQMQRQKREAAEDEQIKLFAQVKEKVAKIRKDRELEMHASMLSLREEISQIVSTEQQNRDIDENRFIKKALMEAEAKYQAEKAEKAAKRQQMLQDVAQCRAEVARRQKELKEQEKEEKRVDQELCDRIIEANQSYVESEQNKMKQKVKQLKEDQMAQQVKAQLEKQQQRQQQNNEAAFYNEQSKMQEIEFLKYADDLIKYAKDRGRPTYPMEKVVKRYKQKVTTKRKPTENDCSD